MNAALAAALRDELARHAPFVQMQAAHVDTFLAAAERVTYPAGAVLLAPEQGAVQHLHWVLHGVVLGHAAEPALRFEGGEPFGVPAAMAAGPVQAPYSAHTDCVCLRLPLAQMRMLAAASAPFADCLQRAMLRFFEHARRASQAAYGARALLEHALETPLGELPRKPPVAVAPGATLAEALAALHERGVGSVLTLDADGAALGILTRHDIVERVALAERPLATPVSAVTSSPVHTLDIAATAQDAVLLMSRHGIRHVPLTERGRVISMVSERDLFALQRLSLIQVSGAIRAAQDVPTLVALARDIRQLARNLLAQGVAARQLTELISHLNDVLTAHLVGLLAVRRGLDLARACWLAFGSEGRSEQTIATDQDNGLLFASDDAERDRPAWLALGREANLALDACGYPRCKGGVMASNPECCLSAQEWSTRFARWMERGTPQDLLKASIYFDLRAIAGASELAAPLRALVTERAQRLPRFRRQLADNALAHEPPLNWLGRIDGERIDLKLQGTAIFVDATRLFALAHGIAATNTRRRVEALAAGGHLPGSEAEVWISAFEFLQTLRLRVQTEQPDAEQPNALDVAALNDIDRLVLREALRIARQMQQRLELDYRR